MKADANANRIHYKNNMSPSPEVRGHNTKKINHLSSAKFIYSWPNVNSVVYYHLQYTKLSKNKNKTHHFIWPLPIKQTLRKLSRIFSFPSKLCMRWWYDRKKPMFESPVACLTLSTLGKIFSRQHFEIFFLFFPKNRIWHLIQTVFIGDNLHEMSNPVF